MKTRNIFKLSCALVAGMLMTSCTDGNDWDVDSAFDRLFGTTGADISLEFTTDDPTQVKVSFPTVPDAQSYKIEISRDSLSDDVAEGGANARVIEVKDNEAASKSTFTTTISDLLGSTKYFLRIKSLAEGKTESKWSYYDDGQSFKTKSEQIITQVTVGSTTVKVDFKAGKTVDKAFIYTSDVDSVGYDVTADEVAAGSKTIEGLTPVTSYRVALYNGDAKRGEAKFKTTEAYPAGYDVLTLAEGDDIIARLAAETNDKVVVVIPQGVTFTMPDGADGTPNLNIPANIKSIYFWGAAGETKPTFVPDGLNFEGNMDLVRFYNLNLENKSSNDDYVICQTSTVDIKAVEIEKCTINKTRGVIRLKDLTGGSMESISINDCVLTDIGSYGIYNGKDQTKTTVKTLSVTNSTISTVNAPLVNAKQAGLSILLDHCTIYNSVPGSKAFFDVNKLNDNKIEVNNTIIGSFYGNKEDGTTVKGSSIKTISAGNTFYTSDFTWNKGYEIGEQVEGKAADIFTDPANGDFTLTSAWKNKLGAYGDQRWNVE